MNSNISSNKPSSQPASVLTPALFQMAFRPFFLLGSLFSIISISLWAGMMTGYIEHAVYAGPLWWHMHEMLFGFVSAIVVGFLLTAVQSWTGIPGIKGGYLMALVILWLSARVIMCFPTTFPAELIILLDLSFLPVAAVTLGVFVVRVKQWRNSIFVPLLLALSCVNGVMHWAAYFTRPDILIHAGTATVLLITLLVSIMAGRVVPMFTANGTRTQRVVDIPWLERAALVTMLLAVLAGSAAHKLPAGVAAFFLLLAAVTLAIRGFRWRIWVTVTTPLVWSLHLSYWCIPMGLLLFGISLLSSLVSHSQAIHALTIGAIGMMILAMISRVSLGHTGRTLTVGTVMAIAFIAMFVAVIVRVFGPYWFGNYSLLIVLSASLWVLAYGSFLVLYCPILTRRRIDGRPG